MSSSDNMSGDLSPEIAQQLRTLEEMTEIMYTSVNAVERKNAQDSLRAFTVSRECIPQCRLILNHSKNNWALIMASSSLLKLVTEFHNSFEAQVTLDIREYLLNYLGRNCNNIHPTVASNLITLVSRLTKLNWQKSVQHRDICTKITNFLEVSVRHCILGLKMLDNLVQTMNRPVANQTNASHRRCAVAFRDSSLFFIFKLAITNLKQLYNNNNNNNMETVELTRHLALSLALHCLQYDYIGTNRDESSDNYGSIQVPESWQPIFQDLSIMKLFFDIFFISNANTSAVCMELLVEFASVRRSIFKTSDLRNEFMCQLCSLLVRVLVEHDQSGILLKNPDSYHHFCRLLDRMKANYTLKELVALPNYNEWIEAVAKFTINSFNIYNISSNSIHYLLGLWGRIALAIPYMGRANPEFLLKFLPQVSQSVMNTRLSNVEKYINDNNIDELFEQPDLGDQLRHLPTLCRHVFRPMYDYLNSRFNEILNNYNLLLNNNNNINQINLLLCEAQLALLVYYIGSIIGAHPNQYSSILANNNNNEHDQYDASLCAMVFQLMPILDMRINKLANNNNNNISQPFKELDLAILSFFDNFRRVFIGHEPVRHRIIHHNSNNNNNMKPQLTMFEQLSQLLGNTSKEQLINGIVKKIFQNLRIYYNEESVLESSLSLLNNLALGYTSHKIMVNLETTKYLLLNHNYDSFEFMNVASNISLRSEFYRVVSRLMFDDNNINYFNQFVLPFENVCNDISNNNPRSDIVKIRGIGLCADLTGLLKGARNSTAYILLFEWIYPKITSQLLLLLETWWDDHNITAEILKFFTHFVHNTGQRISFPISSPNGILIFKELSKAINIYSYKTLTNNNNINNNLTDVYSERIQQIGLCIDAMIKSLIGEYVNFGVFKLYNDPCFTEALTNLLKLIMSVTPDMLLSYTDISENYFMLVSLLFRDHLEIILKYTDNNNNNNNMSDNNIFLALFTSVVDHIDSYNKEISQKSCAAVDNIFTHRYKEGNKRDGPTLVCKLLDKYLLSNPSVSVLLETLITTLFNVFLFDTTRDYAWNLTRPLLPIILCDQNLFSKYQTYLINAQKMEMRGRLADAFTKLSESIEPRVETRYRDLFTQACHTFRHEIKDFCVRPVDL